MPVGARAERSGVMHTRVSVVLLVSLTFVAVAGASSAQSIDIDAIRKTKRVKAVRICPSRRGCS